MHPSETPRHTGGTCTWLDRSSEGSGTRPWGPARPSTLGTWRWNAAALNALWDGLDRVDSPLLGRGILPPVHGVPGGSPADRQKAPLWKFWGAG